MSGLGRKKKNNSHKFIKWCFFLSPKPLIPMIPYLFVSFPSFSYLTCSIRGKGAFLVVGGDKMVIKGVRGKGGVAGSCRNERSGKSTIFEKEKEKFFPIPLISTISYCSSLSLSFPAFSSIGSFT